MDSCESPFKTDFLGQKPDGWSLVVKGIQLTWFGLHNISWWQAATLHFAWLGWVGWV